jgi:hypothetical protein
MRRPRPSYSFVCICCAACGARSALDADEVPDLQAGTLPDASGISNAADAGHEPSFDARTTVDVAKEATADATVDAREAAACEAGPSCQELGLACGTIRDGCGKAIVCGSCPLGSVCGLGGQAGQCAPVTTDCHDDELSGITPLGHLKTHAPGGIVALCSGHVLLGNRDARSIDWVDVRDGKTVRSYPLSALPYQLARDRKRPRIYVAHETARFLSVVDLDTASVRTVDLGEPVAAVSSGAGYVFALTQAGVKSRVMILSADTLEILARTSPTTVDYASMMAFDPNQSRIVVASGGSPPELARYWFNASTVSLTYEESLRSGGGNCKELGFSPDGTRFVMPCGGGNGSGGYTIFDWKADDLKARFGEFDTDAYPAGLAFTSDGARFGTTNSSELFTFDVATHKALDRVMFDHCGNNWPIRVAFSTGDRILFAYAACLYDSELWWRIVP